MKTILYSTLLLVSWAVLALATAIALAGLVLSFLADCGVEASLALHPDKATIRARIREQRESLSASIPPAE